MSTRALISLAVAVAALVALYLVSSTDWFIKEREAPVFEVSVLVDSPDDNAWGNFRLGLEQAALRLNADISFVTLYDGQRPDQQLELLRREISAGAQGLIVSAENPLYLARMMEEVPLGVPVVVCGSTVDSPRIRGQLCPDYPAMAQLLAGRILEDTPAHAPVLLAMTGQERADLAVLAGVLEEGLVGEGREVVRVELDRPDWLGPLYQQLEASPGAVLASPQLEVLEALARELAAAGEETPPLYGVGWSGGIWQGVENGIVTATVAWDGYQSGYFAVQRLVHQLSGVQGRPGERVVIPHVLVTRQTIYDRELELMLFPIN